MSRRVLVLAILLLAACAIAPEGTNLDRMYRSLYHVEHPEYGRPITQAETRVDFTGTHKGVSKIAQAAWEADGDACVKQTHDPRDSWQQGMRRLWSCLWDKGWRWETDAPPSP